MRVQYIIRLIVHSLIYIILLFRSQTTDFNKVDNERKIEMEK